VFKSKEITPKSIKIANTISPISLTAIAYSMELYSMKAACSGKKVMDSMNDSLSTAMTTD
jgi:hypothetical protein